MHITMYLNSLIFYKIQLITILNIVNYNFQVNIEENLEARSIWGDRSPQKIDNSKFHYSVKTDFCKKKHGMRQIFANTLYVMW